jgi:aspartokinase
MKVFKFGGASVNSVERVQNLGEILQDYKGEKLLIVVSAMGKTTNALEKVVKAFTESKTAEALELFATIKRQHLNTAKYLLVTHFYPAKSNSVIFLPKRNGCCMINRLKITIIIMTSWCVPANYFQHPLSVIISMKQELEING